MLYFSFVGSLVAKNTRFRVGMGQQLAREIGSRSKEFSSQTWVGSSVFSGSQKRSAKMNCLKLTIFPLLLMMFKVLHCTIFVNNEMLPWNKFTTLLWLQKVFTSSTWPLKTFKISPSPQKIMQKCSRFCLDIRKCSWFHTVIRVWSFTNNANFVHLHYLKSLLFPCILASRNPKPFYPIQSIKVRSTNPSLIYIFKEQIRGYIAECRTIKK